MRVGRLIVIARLLEEVEQIFARHELEDEQQVR